MHVYSQEPFECLSLNTVYLCRSIVTLYQGQSNPNEHQHAIHKSTVMQSLNAIAYILSEILQL